MSAVRMYHAQCCCWFPQRRSIARRARAGRGERGRRETGGAAVRGREAGAPGGIRLLIYLLVSCLVTCLATEKKRSQSFSRRGPDVVVVRSGGRRLCRSGSALITRGGSGADAAVTF